VFEYITLSYCLTQRDGAYKNKQINNIEPYVYWTVHHCDSWRIRDQLDVTIYYILFHFFYAQHVSDINTSIIRSLRLFYCITTLVLCSCFVTTRIPHQPSHTETPTHNETRTHNQCGDTIEKSQAPDDGCINVRNMLSIEEVKWNLMNCDIKLVSYSSTIQYRTCLCQSKLKENTKCTFVRRKWNEFYGWKWSTMWFDLRYSHSTLYKFINNIDKVNIT